MSIDPRHTIKQDIKKWLEPFINESFIATSARICECIDEVIDTHLENTGLAYNDIFRLVYSGLISHRIIEKPGMFVIPFVHEMLTYMDNYCMRLLYRQAYQDVDGWIYSQDNIDMNWVTDAHIDKVITNGEPIFNMVCKLVWTLPKHIVLCHVNTTEVLDISGELVRLNAIITQLIDRGCNTNIPDSDGVIPIMYTTVPAVFDLVTAENVNAVDNAGKSVMMYAQEDNNTEFIQMLNQRGYVDT